MDLLIELEHTRESFHQRRHSPPSPFRFHRNALCQLLMAHDDRIGDASTIQTTPPAEIQLTAPTQKIHKMITDHITLTTLASHSLPPILCVARHLLVTIHTTAGPEMSILGNSRVSILERSRTEGCEVSARVVVLGSSLGGSRHKMKGGIRGKIYEQGSWVHGIHVAGAISIYPYYAKEDRFSLGIGPRCTRKVPQQCSLNECSVFGVAKNPCLGHPPSGVKLMRLCENEMSVVHECHNGLPSGNGAVITPQRKESQCTKR